MTSTSFPIRKGSIVIDALIGPNMAFQSQTILEWQNGVFTRVEKARSDEVENNRSTPDGVAFPGLIDAHVHLGLDGSADIVSSLATSTQEQISQMILEHASSYIAAGITTVRDLGAPYALVARMKREGALEPPLSPRIIPAQAISSPTGHGNFLSLHAQTAADYRRVIDCLDPNSTPFVKLFASGGVVTQGSNPTAVQMPLRLLRDVTAHCHNNGFRVAAHAHSHESISNCLRSNVDTIEHFSYLDRGLASVVSDSSTYLVSTYVATHRFAYNPNRAGAESEALQKILRHDSAEASALRIATLIPERVIAGSDSGTILNPHPRALHESAKLMVRAGFSDRQALMAITSQSAVALGVSGGELRKGMPADFVISKDNPAVSVKALDSISHVAVAGRLIKV